MQSLWNPEYCWKSQEQKTWFNTDFIYFFKINFSVISVPLNRTTQLTEKKSHGIKENNIILHLFGILIQFNSILIQFNLIKPICSKIAELLGVFTI